MIFELDFVDDRLGECSSVRGRDRLEDIEEWIDAIVHYRCRRRGVERFSSTVRAWDDEAEARERERMVDGVDDAVESNELRSCWVDERETVRNESFLLMSEFCSLAM